MAGRLCVHSMRSGSGVRFAHLPETQMNYVFVERGRLHSFRLQIKSRTASWWREKLQGRGGFCRSGLEAERS